MILVYSTLIYNFFFSLYKYKQLNSGRFACNSSTAVQILGHKGKGLNFSINGKIFWEEQKKTKKSKNAQKNTENREIFSIFKKGTFIHATIASVVRR